MKRHLKRPWIWKSNRSNLDRGKDACQKASSCFRKINISSKLHRRLFGDSSEEFRSSFRDSCVAVLHLNITNSLNTPHYLANESVLSSSSSTSWMFNKSPLISIQVSASTITHWKLKFEQKKRAYRNKALYSALFPEKATVCDLFIRLNFRLLKWQVSKSDANSRGNARVKAFRSEANLKVQRSQSSWAFRGKINTSDYCDNARILWNTEFSYSCLINEYSCMNSDIFSSYRGLSVILSFLELICTLANLLWLSCPISYDKRSWKLWLRVFYLSVTVVVMSPSPKLIKDNRGNSVQINKISWQIHSLKIYEHLVLLEINISMAKIDYIFVLQLGKWFTRKNKYLKSVIYTSYS